VKTVFVNPERCIGCRQCEFACAVEHSESRDAFLALAEDPLPRPRIHVEAGPWFNTSFPNRCRHCNPAPCEQVCPSGAIFRDAEEDLVLIEARQCITCAMCAMVCPFDAVTFHAQTNGAAARVVATKCDGCVDRVRRREEPACSEVCKVDALVSGELNELVKAGRLRESAAVLSAVSRIEPTAPAGPETLAGWRAWGEAATNVAEEVHDERAASR
jgi:carbon-monoxide dehydrogenase iron sulfur subunit